MTPNGRRVYWTDNLAGAVSVIDTATSHVIATIVGITGTSRATFEYGDEILGEPHIVWRRIGTHDVFRRP